MTKKKITIDKQSWSSIEVKPEILERMIDMVVHSGNLTAQDDWWLTESIRLLNLLNKTDGKSYAQIKSELRKRRIDNLLGDEAV